jgi:15-cis-phytoene desaturase
LPPASGGQARRPNPIELLDPQHVSPASDVVIIGGGLAGLACAVALRGSGLRISLFEADAMLGGRARSWIDAQTGDVIDLGPHVIMTEHRNMLALLELLGTRQRVVWETDRLIRLRDDAGVTDMHLHRLPAPLHLVPGFMHVRGIGWRELLSNRRVLDLAMRLDERQVRALDARSAAELLEHCGVTKRFVNLFWKSACISVLNVPLERCSAGALLRVFAQLVGLQQYRFGFPDGGLAELFVPAALRWLEESGAHIYSGSRVERILCEGERFSSIVMGSGERVQARICVAAVPPQSLTSLVAADWIHARPFSDLAAFEPSPYVSSYLWFDRKLTDDKFWMRIWDESRLNVDFYDLTNIRSGWRDRDGSVIASNIIYSHRAAALDDEQIVSATVRELQEAFPAARRCNVRHAVVNRIPMAITCPAPGTESKRPPVRTPIEGLLLAGDWTRTELPASMESAVHSGWTAAEEIWRSIGKPRGLVLPKRALEGVAGFVHRRAGTPAQATARIAPPRCRTTNSPS